MFVAFSNTMGQNSEVDAHVVTVNRTFSAKLGLLDTVDEYADLH